MESTDTFKVILDGAMGVGKSQILNRFCRNQFNSDHNSTIGVEFSTVMRKISEDEEVKLQMWDLSGNEKYSVMTSAYYKGAHFVIFVYDITNRDSFDYVATLIKKLESHWETVNEDLHVLIVANKSDLQYERKVTYQEGQKLAENIGGFVEVSAKTAYNIDNGFVVLYDRKINNKPPFIQLIKKFKENAAPGFVGQQNNSKFIEKNEATCPESVIHNLDEHTECNVIVKMVLLGDQATGKTCFSLKYVNDQFTQTYLSTIGIDFRIKPVKYLQKVYKLQIWDTAGQQRFRSITTNYLKGASAFIIMFDVTNLQTFEKVQTFYDSILTYNDSQKKYIAIVGNKIDDTDNRKVSKQMGLKLAEDLKCPYFETSALKGQGIRDVFQDLVCTYAKYNNLN